MTAKFSLWMAAILGGGGALIGVSYWGYQKVSRPLDEFAAEIASDFPEVEHVPPATLAGWMDSEPNLLVIDCRDPREYAVSRVPGALNFEMVRDAKRFLESAPKPARIVVYCSIGYRSAKFATALKRAGFDNAVNLRGAIFQWANEDRPLETPDGATTGTVHPYNEFWGRLLRPEKRAK